jgi:hypothetical protein
VNPTNPSTLSLATDATLFYHQHRHRRCPLIPVAPTYVAPTYVAVPLHCRHSCHNNNRSPKPTTLSIDEHYHRQRSNQLSS